MLVVDFPNSQLHNVLVVDFPYLQLHNVLVVDFPYLQLHNVLVIDFPYLQLYNVLVVGFPYLQLHNVLVVDFPNLQLHNGLVVSFANSQLSKVKTVLLSGEATDLRFKSFTLRFHTFHLTRFLLSSQTPNIPPLTSPSSILNVYAKPILILNLQYTGCMSIMQQLPQTLFSL